MVILRRTKELDSQQVYHLYDTVGWSYYTDRKDVLMQAINRSLYCLVAFENQQVVGLLRAIGDHYTVLYIQDLLVLPEFQHQGIGRALLERALVDNHKISQIYLSTSRQDPQTMRFYEHMGFVKLEEVEVVGYVYQKKH